MKVTHIIIGLGVGGAELMLKRLIESSNKEDIEHKVISLTTLGKVGKELEKASIDVKCLGMTKSWMLPITLWKLAKELKKNRPDIVHTWMYHADFIGGLAARLVGIKNIIWGVRTTDVKAGASKATIILRSFCALVSHSLPKVILYVAEVSKNLHESIGYDKSKSVVIPNGFNLDELNFSWDKRIKYRRDFDVLEENKVIVSVGRFNAVKDQKAFIETASILLEKDTKLIFFIIGRGNDCDNRELVSWINEKNLIDNFRLLGEQKDVSGLLSAADIFLLHSKTEGFPNALGEAMAIGIPSAAMNVGDVPVLMGEVGFIAEKNTPEFLAIEAKKILELNNSEVESYSASLKEIMKSKFTLSEILKKYLDLYKKVL